ncbi:hypothetical protein AWH56_026355 [Anaerobacillus isosaccharinicus]|uniref:Uncharacterized protein n=1 Tax=Anaerobacillus isosaccharinicus TaxID=1532552 RepID=A0A1S2M2F2_9BACI|nr:hypothetical protein [Anaerobacillus isosaccharinicus]MBA5585570.1 hypothetical protein [Anaerobacillus isosaccharinicus]QOY36117.1 hypothetical protein AWH56_026355 [Anaerobacillus isosaccharinicus]
MNKFVFLLPVSVMFLLFYFGYQYINSSETATNESLQNDIVISLDANRSGQEVLLRGTWDWTQMPVDGLIGDDYIMITIKQEDDTPINSLNVLSAELFLLKGEQQLQSVIGEVDPNGIVFTFPNKIVDHESFGNRGEIEVVLYLADEASYIATFTYVHTWVDHQLVGFNQLYSLEAGLQDILTNKYWSVKRFLEF